MYTGIMHHLIHLMKSWQFFYNVLTSSSISLFLESKAAKRLALIVHLSIAYIYTELEVVYHQSSRVHNNILCTLADTC